MTAKALIDQLGEKHIAAVIDISLNGAHLQTDADLDRDAPLKLQVIFDELTPPIKMHTKIVYHKDNNYGVECLEIDIDSMLQLRTTLSLYNSDPNAIHRESQALWEIKSEQAEE